MELYQIVLLVLAAVVAGLYIYKRITGNDLLRHVMLSRPVVKALGAAVEAVYHMWPNTKTLKTVYVIMQAAISATETAEKAYKIGMVKPEERNVYAKALVKETLEAAGIEITPQVSMIIDGMIEAVCFVLPHENGAAPDPEVVGEN